MADTASTIMTRDVASVPPGAGVPEIAKLLASRQISAVPVVDGQGKLLGMVSEGDLMKPFSAENQKRREWWLDMLAEGEQLAPDFAAYISLDQHTAMDLMTKKPVTVAESTTIPEIADILIKNRIKRVPVLRDGKVVGIVSRADLVRTLARQPAQARPEAS